MPWLPYSASTKWDSFTASNCDGYASDGMIGCKAWKTHLLRNNTVEIDEGSGHPDNFVRLASIREASHVHVDPAVGKALSFLKVAIPFQAYPCHDLMRRPSIPEVEGERRYAHIKPDDLRVVPLTVRPVERDLTSRLLRSRHQATQHLELLHRLRPTTSCQPRRQAVEIS